MKNVLILEDDEIYMNKIAAVIENISSYITIHKTTDRKTAYELALENNIHLFLVDIMLSSDNPNDISGLEFVQRVRNIEQYAFRPVIFISSLCDPKFVTYSQLHCFSYIEKPFSDLHLKRVVLHALKFPVSDNTIKDVFFKKDGVIFVKRESEIIYVECIQHKIYVHCINDTLKLPYQSVENMLKQISSDNFIQCSRNCIINRRFIEKIDYANRFIKLRNIERKLSIGSVMKKKFKYLMEHN